MKPNVVVIVEVVVGQDGLPRNPRIVFRKGAVPFLFSTLDAVRKWKFEPAKLNGTPVAVIYNLTVNYAS